MLTLIFLPNLGMGGSPVGEAPATPTNNFHFGGGRRRRTSLFGRIIRKTYGYGYGYGYRSLLWR